jgi:hypothetical protein
VRYNSDGSLDAQFGDPVSQLDGNPTYTGNGPVVLDADVQINDAELQTANNYSGTTLTLQRHGAANISDVFTAQTGGTLSALTSGNFFSVSGVTIGRVVSNGSGTLQLGFNSNATQALVSTAMQQIAYENTASLPSAKAQIDWTFSDGNTGSQGSGGALTATGSTLVNITARNVAPVLAQPLADVSIFPSQLFSYVLPANAFTDANPDTTLTYTIAMFNNTALPTWLAFDPVTRTFSGNPGALGIFDISNFAIKVTVQDFSGASASDVFRLSVASGSPTNDTNGNASPTGSLFIYGTVTQGKTLNASNALNDIDGIPISGFGAIAYQWKADGASITGATASTYTLTQAAVGKAITVTAYYTDQQGTDESVTSASTAAVANVNDAPSGTVTVTVSGTTAQGQSLTAANTLADIDGLGTISYQWKAGATVLGTGSSLLLDQSHVGQQITVTASYTDWQGTAEAVSSVATVAVASANSEPIARDTPVSAIEDTLLSGRFLAVDPDGDTLSYRIVQGPEHGTVSLSSDGSFLYRPASNFNGLDSFQYMASDGQLESNEATVSLNVQAVNDAPLGTGKTWTISEDTSLVLSPEVFGFRDVDAADSLQAVRFTIIASKGNILLNGEAVTVGQEIAVSELQAGHLVYTPLANGFGAPYVNLRFQVSDGQEFSRASYMLSVKVNPVRDDLVLYGTDGNDTINGDLIDVGSLDQLYGLAGNDRLIGRYARDTIVGGTGADTIYGGDGSDILKFAAGDSGQVTGFDVVADYQRGARSTGDLIDYAKSMTIGGTAAVATATQASINASTGVATFASGSGMTMADALADVAARMTAASDAAGEMAFFQVSKKGHMMLFISDGVAGATTNDVVVQLMGISAINQIDLTGGNLTILG